MKKEKSNNILFYVVFLTIIGQVAIDLYLPSMFGMIQSLKMSKVLVQWTVSVYLLGYGFSQLIYGPLSDYIGRRKVAIIGMTLYVIASIGCTLSFSPNMILVSRILQGLGSGAASVIARAIMRDSFTGKELIRSSSCMAMAWSLVPILAPVLGGVIENYFGWRGNFAFLFILSGGLLISILKNFPETCTRLEKDNSVLKKCIDNYLILFKSYKFVLNMVILIALFAVFAIFNVASPFIFQTILGMSASEYSVVLCLISLGYLIGSYANGKILKKMNSVYITLIGILLLFVMSISMLGLGQIGLYSNTIPVILYMMIVFIGLGLIFSNSISACLQPFPNNAGTASAMYGFLVFVSGSLISGIYSKYTTVSITPLVLVILGISIIMLISHIVILFFRKRENQEIKVTY